MKYTKNTISKDNLPYFLRYSLNSRGGGILRCHTSKE